MIKENSTHVEVCSYLYASATNAYNLHKNN